MPRGVAAGRTALLRRPGAALPGRVAIAGAVAIARSVAVAIAVSVRAALALRLLGLGRTLTAARAVGGLVVADAGHHFLAGCLGGGHHHLAAGRLARAAPN